MTCHAPILEATKVQKKYKCKYCEMRLERDKLIDHIEEEHGDLIPKDYSSTRIVFNIINKKENGNCVVCRKVTGWNSNTLRYERFCSGTCIKKYKSIRDERMMKTHGQLYLTTDEEFQKKMLDNRSISGTYKFSSGGTLSYVGSYEKNFLGFADTFGFTVKDIMAPGPTIIYKDKNGVERKWITDYYIIPFNLVIDVKDGGSNPNNRNMEEYRAKQIAKEKAIVDQGEYNYLRLTDNDFQQFFSTIAEIKFTLMDEDLRYNKVIKIYENISLDIETPSFINESSYNVSCQSEEEFIKSKVELLSYSSTNYVYLIYFEMNGRILFGITDNLTLHDVIVEDFFHNVKVINIHNHLDKISNLKVFKRLYKENISFEYGSLLYYLVTGSNIETLEDLIYSDQFEPVTTILDYYDFIYESIYNTIKRSTTKYNIDIPITENIYIDLDNKYYLLNEDIGLISKKVDYIELLSEPLFTNFIRNGIF